MLTNIFLVIKCLIFLHYKDKHSKNFFKLFIVRNNAKLASYSQYLNLKIYYKIGSKTL